VPGAAIDRGFFAGRIDRASALRAAVVPPDTDGYRLINAEGDGLPGWTVDRYGPVLVSQMTVSGLEALRGEAYAALAARFPEAAIVHLGEGAAHARRGSPRPTRWSRASSRCPRACRSGSSACVSPPRWAAAEDRVLLRPARQPGSRRQAGRRPHGARPLRPRRRFGVHALAGGARSLVQIESSPRFAEPARAARADNGLEDGRATWVVGDVFAELRVRTERFGLVICDPPPLARRRAEVERAARAYKDLNRLALRRVEPGGFLLTFSCSGAVDGRLFRQILFAAAREAGVEVRLLAALGRRSRPSGRPGAPRGEYLKGWWPRSKRAPERARRRGRELTPAPAAC